MPIFIAIMLAGALLAAKGTPTPRPRAQISTQAILENQIIILQALALTSVRKCFESLPRGPGSRHDRFQPSSLF